MLEDTDKKQLANDMSEAIEKSMDDKTPTLSIDPKTSKPGVVGDPTKIPEKRGTYKLTFAYSPDEVSEEDKTHMKLHEKTGYYLAEVTYENIFIKPLYRARISMLATKILADAKIIDLKGYTSEVASDVLGESFITHTNDIVEIIKMMLKLDDSQIEHLMPTQPGNFFVQLFQNEPNLIKEANNFLS